MAVSRYNAEGYHDLTAYEAIRRADADAGKLKITYPRGCMELNLEGLFPCMQDKARKLFSLIHRYSPEKDKDKVDIFLHRLEKQYWTEMQVYADKASDYPINSAKYREYTVRFKTMMRLRQRTAKNIALFTAGRDNG